MTKVSFAVRQVQNVELVKMKGQFSVKFSRNVCCLPLKQTVGFCMIEPSGLGYVSQPHIKVISQAVTIITRSSLSHCK